MSFESKSVKRPTRAEINLDNLEFNFNSVKEFTGGGLVMAVVKADAYGHGAVECARRLESAGVDWFAVALTEEGVELRESGIRKRILCLGGFWEGQERELLNHSITPVIFDLDSARRFDNAASEGRMVAAVHVKIDTGMGRVGVPFRQAREFAASLRSLQNLRVEGLMTHFAAAENPSENDFTSLQIQRFHDSVFEFRNAGHNPQILDLANSPGAVAHPESRSNLIRLGGVLYGLGQDVLPQNIENPELKPVMSLHSQIEFIKNVAPGETLGYGRTFTVERDSVIATLPIGYRDGYRRGLSNQGKVLVGGKVAPVVGRVSMDWTLIDVTDISNVEVGDDVVLFGGDGDNEITAADLAQICDTISYEITCGISPRVPRKYVG
ncbi:MAG: alanine racemase [Pyrinomonadaceae bacterium]